MNRHDFLKLVGAESSETEYLPVAFLLTNGYACVGNYHAAVNEELNSTCVLLNAHVIELQGDNKGGRPSVADFNEFLEEVVVDFCNPESRRGRSARSEAYGKPIPLTAIPFDQIAVVYPVAHISALLRRAERKESRVPSFLDLQQSEIIGLLRTRLW